MEKSWNKRVGNSFFAVVLLAIFLFMTGLFGLQKTKTEQAANASFLDSILSSPIMTTITKAAPAFTFVNGAISLAGSIYKGVSAAVDAEDGQGVKSFFNALIGGTDLKLDNIQQTLNSVSGKVDEINSKLDQINSDLTGITKQLNSMLNTITTQLQQSVEEITVNLYESQLQMRDWTTIYTQINDFYNKYADVRRTLLTHIETVTNTNTNYEQFLQQVESLENGDEIMAVLDKISLNYEQSYNNLSQQEQELLSTKVQYNGNSYAVGKYVSDYIRFLYGYLKDAYTSFASGYSTNMYTTLLNMADYIVGNKSSLDCGIGEIFYKLALMGSTNSVEVHNSYKNFMSNVITDFMLTGYVCNLSLKMQVNYLEAYEQNVSEIQTYKDYIENIERITAQALAYVDYEYYKCKQEYDINGFVPELGYTADDYVVFYGNTLNALTTGSDKSVYVLKKNMNQKDITVNEQYVYIASGETFELKAYLQGREIQEDLTWQSTDNTVAIISQEGYITGILPGSCEIGIVLDDEFYPLVSVSVSSAYAIKNGTNQNIWVSSTDESASSYAYASNNGYTYTYDANIFMANDTFDTSMYKTCVLDDLVENSDAFSFITNSDIIQIDENIARAITETSGSITAKGQIEGKNVIIQIPVCGYTISTDETNETKNDETVSTDVKYIYTKEDLYEWQDSLRGASSADPTTSSIKLMNDIDFGWDVWEMDPQCKMAYSAYDRGDYHYYDTLTFDGNGHEIKNITFKGVMDPLYSKYPDSHNYEYFGFFSIFAGKIKNLTINNVAYLPCEDENEDTICYYSIIGASGIQCQYSFYIVYDTGDIYMYEPEITNCVFKGEVNIVTDNNFVFAPISTKSPYSAGQGRYSGTSYTVPPIKGCINDMDVVVDCQGADITADMSGSINNVVDLWQMGFLYTGTMTVLNIADLDKVRMSVIANEVKNTKTLSIENCAYYYSYSTFMATNSLGEMKEFTAPSYCTEVTQSQSTDLTFWSGLGMTEEYFNLDGVLAPYSAPTLKSQNPFVVDATNFRSYYAVGEDIDYSGLKIFDQEGNDVTSQVEFAQIDNMTPGEKTLTGRYGTASFILYVKYFDLDEVGNLSYLPSDGSIGTQLVENFVPNKEHKLAGSIFTRLGYTQVGWSTTNGGSIEYELNQPVLFDSTQSVALYPVFEANTNTSYKIEYFYENLDGEYILTNEEILYGTTDTIIQPKIQGVSGFTADYEETKISGAGDTVLRVYLTRKTYTVNWFNEDMSLLKTEQVKYEALPTYDGEVPQKAADNYYTYTFDKWDKDIIECTGNTQYIATYTSALRVYNIDFQLAGGEFVNVDSISKNYTYSQGIDLPTMQDVKKLGYKFLGWTYSEDAGEPYLTQISNQEYGDKTLYAHWEQYFTYVEDATSGNLEVTPLENTDSGIDLSQAFKVADEKNLTLNVNAGKMSIQFGSNAIDSLKNQNSVLFVKNLDTQQYKNAQAVFEFSLNSDNLSSDDVVVSYTVENDVPQGKHIQVLGYDSEGKPKSIQSHVDGQMVSFSIGSFDTYAVIFEDDITSLQWALIITIPIIFVMAAVGIILFVLKRKKIKKII